MDFKGKLPVVFHFFNHQSLRPQDIVDNNSRLLYPAQILIPEGFKRISASVNVRNKIYWTHSPFLLPFLKQLNLLCYRQHRFDTKMSVLSFTDAWPKNITIIGTYHTSRTQSLGHKNHSTTTIYLHNLPTLKVGTNNVMRWLVRWDENVATEG